MRFCTEELPLAAFISATRRLPFLGCESVNGNGRIAFVFDDAKSEREQIHIRFESGAVCPERWSAQIASSSLSLA